jgi:drug/metabolite transporter (DMT)-like permease
MVLIGVAWLREKLKPVEWLALGVAFCGAALVSQGAGHLNLAGAGLRGDLLMIVAAFFGAVYSIGGKRLVADHPAEVVTAVVAAIGALFLLPLAAWEMTGGTGLALPEFAATGAPMLGLPLQVWAALLLLGAGAGALANLWWLNILGYTSASRAGMALFLIPVISTALSVMALNEPLTVMTVIGALLVLGGIAVTQRDRERRAKGE